MKERKQRNVVKKAYPAPVTPLSGGAAAVPSQNCANLVFEGFVAPGGKCQAEDVLVDKRIKAKFRALAEKIRCMQPGEWQPGWVKKLKGVEDCYELRFKTDVQQRPLGYFTERYRSFVVLLWATEKSDRLSPTNWKEIFANHRAELRQGRGDTRVIL